MASTEVKKAGGKKWEKVLKHFEAIPLSPRFSISLEKSPSFEHLSASKKRLIDAIWDQEQKRKSGRLFNGMILSAKEYTEKKLTGFFVPYKYFLAQVCDPSLKPDLNILPVSLSAVTVTEDSMILAKRASWVTQYPDAYELAPSGGVTQQHLDDEAIDIKGQLLEELNEEVGIDRQLVKKLKFFSMVRDYHADAVELVAEIQVKPFSIQSSTGEYAQIMTLPISEIPAFVATYKAEFVPLSLAILKLREYIE
ncbi:MAG: hypothetical protein ACK5MA_11655 [Parachlamydiaceae bacterium]